jgi:hypothetical protein
MRGDESFSHAAIIDLTDDASRAGVTAGVLCRYHRSVPSARRFPHRGRRGNRSVLHRARRHQAGAGLRLLRGRTGTTDDGQAAHRRRGAAHRRQYAKLPELLRGRPPKSEA